MKETQITAYVTKYALTKGIIQKVEAELCLDSQPDGTMIRVKGNGTLSNLTQYFHKNDWSKTPEEALSHTSTMQKNKIKSLHNEIKKLENMTFKIE